MKILIGMVIGAILTAGGFMALSEPKQVFGGLRRGIDKAEQIQVAECRESEASCYLTKTQKECDVLIKQKCGG